MGGLKASNVSDELVRGLRGRQGGISFMGK